MIREEDLFEGFTIGEWEVLPAKGILRRGDEEEHPEPKVFAVLIALARRDGNLTTNDDLIAEVWEGRAFDNQPIQRAIALLRKHLQDTKPFQYIETLQRRGYRLIQPVQIRKPSKSQTQVVSSPGLSWRRGLAIILILGLFATITLTLVMLDAEPSARSIVVLPFENMTGDPDQEYLSDGLSEEILNLLVQVPELTVISRFSAFSFKGKSVDIPTVAKQLNVSHVLEGSIRRMGNRVRITAQLIEASTDSHIWSDTYERDISDIFAVQDEIAERVVTELQVSLLGEIPASHRTDTEAYSLYLQAQHIASQGHPSAYRNAKQLLERAIGIDESYAPAWAALSSVLVTEVNSGLGPNQEKIESARTAAHQALELDPELALAHIEMARIAMTFDWDYATAVAHIEAVRPRDLQCLQIALLALYFGQFDVAAKWGRRAVELDPVSPRAHRRLGLALLANRQLADAEEEFRKAVMLSPRSVHSLFNMAFLYLEQGKPEEALRIAEEIQVQEAQIFLRSLAMFAMGDVPSSDEQLDQYVKQFAEQSAANVAALFAFREDFDQAFQWLERAYEERNTTVSSIRFDPAFRKLRGHPKMQPFLGKIGLSDGQLADINLDSWVSQ